MSNQKTFIEFVEKSINENTFVRLTLSKNKEKKSDLKKVIFKLATIRKSLHLSTVFRHRTKDITKNFLLKEGVAQINQLFVNQFFIANLFTIKEDLSLEMDASGKTKMRTNKPTFPNLPERKHDKTKQRLISKTHYLQELGVLDIKGGIQKDKGDKYKQINKFIEIIDGLVRQHPILKKKKHINVVDMGAGKGYLTFALYDYLVNTFKTTSTIKGIEIRRDLIEKCNRIAEKVGFKQLVFEEGFISDYQLDTTDILIALHACDTATDDAIYKGIEAKAELIICAPCCHKQIRKQITRSELLQPILDYGILKERQAEMLTDTIRALLLEANGYKTKVFEFISTEHTGKNVMIIGQKHNNFVDEITYQKKIATLKQAFGIDYHYLEKLLNSHPVNTGAK